MRDLQEHLTAYAAYHRDPRNIATHYLGIPAIMLGIAGLLARPFIDVGGMPLSITAVISIAFVCFYLRLDLRLGLVMATWLFGTTAVGHVIAEQSTALWLTASLALFGVGWATQFLGHLYEGKKPAFVDDIVGLFQGPLYLVAESAFSLGLRPALRDSITDAVGPVCRRQAGTRSVTS